MTAIARTFARPFAFWAKEPKSEEPGWQKPAIEPFGPW